MNVRLFVFQDHPNPVFITLSAVSSFFALRPTQSHLSISITLAIILIYSRILFHGEHSLKNTGLLSIAITLAGTLSKLQASLHALSTPGVSVLVLFALSGVTSILTLAIVYVDTKLCTRLGGTWSQITLFPALWSTLWFAVAYISPVGRLSTWSSTQREDFYDWMIPFFGAIGYDWVVAAWAVVCFQVVGIWYMGEQDEDLLIAHDAPATGQPKHSLSQMSATVFLAILLALLSIPSFLFEDFPLAVLSPVSTPLRVGCILPPYNKHHMYYDYTLDDYIKESKKLENSANILLWPEGAVTFNSEAERDEGLAKVQESVIGSHVGVSFEETFRDPSKDSGRSSSRRTGLAIVSRSPTSPHLVYYKRHLVPIAESFSLSHSTAPPSIFTLELPHPKDINKTEWAPGPNYTRPIPLTASICLDFSDPLPFAKLSSRPGLILAPARTWDISVGRVMWQQARQRAEELGTIILWCDGGDGGVSGVGGGGFHDFTQVGLGSWVRTIGIQYPFNDHRTPYAYLGHIVILIFWALVFGGSLGDYIHGLKGLKGVQHVRSLFWERRGDRHTQEARDLLS